MFYLSDRLRQVLQYCDKQARIRSSVFIGKKKCFFDCTCISIKRFTGSIPNHFVNQTMFWTAKMLLCCCVHLMLFCLAGGIFQHFSIGLGAPNLGKLHQEPLNLAYVTWFKSYHRDFINKCTYLLTMYLAANHRPPDKIRVRNWKLFFLFLNQNICCGYSKEPSR